MGTPKNLVEASDIFYFFLLGGGGGKGESEAPGKDRFSIENPRRGRGGRLGGAEWPGGCLRRIGEILGEGGVNFFSGPK